jgi:hypothetical protein
MQDPLVLVTAAAAAGNHHFQSDKLYLIFIDTVMNKTIFQIETHPCARNAPQFFESNQIISQL